ncbi:putative cysteine proteinase A494 [Mycobacterium intracellulare subsp. intracellulare MTCC 9506]|uniref:Putative cysteine proteinase A494 n=1 Tax=Mycobacterium indicus pranii (strain DSM 45239 / MTCC 9506) TaxID=1232724 RepID=J9W840_MYCIP|nr:putative cysteine proteinase A494 [Mycobacterium intracellulare subsp. intracellulare MTCC 9506]
MAVVLKLVEVNSWGSCTAQLPTMPDGSLHSEGSANAAGTTSAAPTTGTDNAAPRMNTRREKASLMMSVNASASFVCRPTLPR